MILLLSIYLFFSLSNSITSAQFTASSTSNARALDAFLQNYAYDAFLHPKTGVVYDGAAPSNLTGIQFSAVRFRSGSLRTRGFSMYKEFEIPKGIVEHPYVERLVLVYHNLGNWSNSFYQLQNHTFLAPVLGLLAYDASDLTARNLPELSIHASDQPIHIHFTELRAATNGTVRKCVSFHTNGSIDFSNVLSDNVCATFQPGHFSIVVESIAPFPAIDTTNRGGNAAEDGSKVGVIVGCVVGGFAVVAVVGFVVVQMSKYSHRKRMDNMEKAAEMGEALNMTNVGGTKAPAATGTRTVPKLETEFVP